MTVVMIKKQMMEIFRNYFFDTKKGVARTKKEAAIRIAGYLIFVLGLFGFLFGSMAASMCAPCVAAGQDWIYFMIFSAIAVLLGIFGSVFSTYAELYLARDNDLLLSLPIPVGAIMTARLVSVYLMGLLFSAGATLPAVVVYAMNTPFRISALIGWIFWILLVSIFVMVLSCLLGWVVAKISTKLKRKGVVTAFLAVGAMVFYYLLYGKSMGLIMDLINNVESVGKAEGILWVFYLIGSIGTGNPLSILICSAACALMFFLLWLVMKRSFIDIVTTKTAVKKTAYRETTAKQKTALQALSGKERMRFLGSPIYMLNCGLGLLLLPAMGIFLLIKGKEIAEPVASMLGTGPDGVTVLFTGVICLISSLNMISTPSVSLEGKNLWILKSLPVSSYEILNGKLQNHITFGIIPAAFTGVCTGAAFGASWPVILLVLLISYLHVYFIGLIGLYMGLKHANLSWSNENIPIKQSISILLTMVIGGVSGALIAILYFPFSFTLDPKVYLGIVLAAEAILVFLLLRWVKTKGVEIFERL